MISRKMHRNALFAIMTAGTLAACGGASPDSDSQASQNADSSMSGMVHDSAPAMSMDPAMMHRHGEEMDSAVVDLRLHLEQMRALSPQQWHERMDQHAPAVARMLSLMDRQMREMDMGMNMNDAQMGAAMGMSGAEYHSLTRELQALRAEVVQLQTATRDSVRAGMPAHLDRIERLLDVMKESAAYMRSSGAPA